MITQLETTSHLLIYIYIIHRFYGLTDRMSKMEATIAPIVTKLDTILNKIDDAKRIKMKKKETMQRLIENIEEDDQSMSIEK